MDPITKNVPKPLISICGYSLIEHVISTCLEAGIEEITIGLGYKGKQVREAVEKSTFTDSIDFVKVDNYRNGPLQTLVTSLETIQDRRVLVLPSDLVISSSLVCSFLEYSNKMESKAILGVSSSTKNPRIHLDGSGYVLGIGEFVKSASKSVSSAMLLSLANELFSSLRSTLKTGCSQVSEALNQLINEGIQVRSAPVDGLCFDIDTHSAILQGSRYFLESHFQGPSSILIPVGDVMDIGDTLQLHNDISIHQGVSIQGPVSIDKGCIIEKQCKIGPYVSLGPGSLVRHNSVLRNTLTTSGTAIDANSHIQDAVVHNNIILRG